jgi:hypothetical protein
MNRLTLTRATWIYMATFTIHNADHARRGVAAVRDAVLWGGTMVAMLTAVLATLVIVRHERAPAFAAVVGPAIAFGVSASHLAPDWGPLSDSLTTGDVDIWTWLAVLGEIAGAALVGATGLNILRRHHLESRIPAAQW